MTLLVYGPLNANTDQRGVLHRLDEGADRGLVLVAASAGYGKSVLLAEWARDRTPPVAWLSLDAGDNDPVRFWRHVLAALDLARPGIAERVGPLAGPPAPPSYDALVSALINDVEMYEATMRSASPESGPVSGIFRDSVHCPRPHGISAVLAAFTRHLRKAAGQSEIRRRYSRGPRPAVLAVLRTVAG